MRSFKAVLVTLWMVACDAHHPPEPDGGPTTDASPALGEIRVVGEHSILLGPRESATFAVRWTNAEGMLVPMGDVHLALEGRPRDSSLFSLISRTNDAGEASGTIIAGELPATFRIRITASNAVPAYIDVAVGTEGFGSLSIRVEGAPLRPASRRVVLLHQGTPLSCSDALARPEADRTRTTDETGTVEFGALPAGQLFTIVARAENEGGIVVSDGCVEGVRVQAEQTITQRVELLARPLRVEGEYSVTLELAPDSSPQRLLESVAEAVDVSILAVGGDAELMLDGLDTALRERDATELADALMNERMTDDLRAAVAAALDDFGKMPSTAAHALLLDVAERTRSFRIEGTLAIARAAASASLASFTRRNVHIGPPGPTHIVVNLAEQGVEARTPVTLNWSMDDDRLIIDELIIPLPLGRLTSRIIEEMAIDRGESGAADLIRNDSGCERLALFIDQRPDIAAECDAGCTMASCNHAVDVVLSVARVAIGSLDDPRARLRLSGATLARDSDGDLDADTLPGTTFTGTWGNVDDTASAPVESSFEGARAAPRL